MTHKILIILIVAMMLPLYVYAQDDITMVVSGSGKTKEEAVASALRSGIEQAFGSFVSSNTSILNDELVKDEIVSVTSGVVKSYREVTLERLAPDICYATLKATFSLNRMTIYAESKGASAELAGNTFAINMKLREMNKRNESAVLDNLAIQVKEMIPYVFERKIKMGELSYMNGNNLCLPLQVGVTFSNVGKQMLGLLYNTLKTLAISQQEKEEYERLNISYFKVDLYGMPYVKGFIPYEERYAEVTPRISVKDKYKEYIPGEDGYKAFIDRYYLSAYGERPEYHFNLRNVESLNKILDITKLLVAESRHFEISSNKDDVIKCNTTNIEGNNLNLRYSINSPGGDISSIEVSTPLSVCYGELYGALLKCYLLAWKVDRYDNIKSFEECSTFDYWFPIIKLIIRSDHISEYSSFNIKRPTD